MPYKNRNDYNAYKRKWRMKKVKQGLCTICFKNPAMHDYCKCWDCMVRHSPRLKAFKRYQHEYIEQQSNLANKNLSAKIVKEV